MKSALFFLASAAAAAAVERAIPSIFPPERYEVLIAKSPFALATAPAPPAAPPDKSFADGWFVSGLARLDGKDFVTIKSRDLSTQFSLFGLEPDKNGVELKKVEWLPTIGRSTVTIAKDGVSAKLEFNQAELQAAPSAPGGGAPMPPGASRPPMPVNTGVPRTNIPRPVQPVVQPQPYPGLPNTNNGLQKPNNGVVTGLPNVNPINGGPPAPDNHRRIRVINTAPGQ
jgi:hypothetical protein